MKWTYWIHLYTRTHCVARGLSPNTIAAYENTLNQFRRYVDERWPGRAPDQIHSADILRYLQHLREVRGNGDSAINRTLVIIANFYRAMVAMDQLDARDAPTKHFPKIKAVPKKLPVTLNTEEVSRLLEIPNTDTVLGVRDRAILALLYGTGIRASECSGLRACDVDVEHHTITVIGKGRHQRTLPLNSEVIEALQLYARARGPTEEQAPFFRSKRARAMSRGAIFERVRTWAKRARLPKLLSPHKLRHTFATHLVRAGVGLVTIRDLLGHRQITSTQIYLHVSAHDLRDAADRHPIRKLLHKVQAWLPGTRIPIQHACIVRGYG